MNVQDQLLRFLSYGWGSLWLNSPQICVYVRRSKRYFNGQWLEFLDIANVNVPDEYRGQGYFKQFIQFCESLGLNIYVECIRNPNLLENLVKHGYTLRPGGLTENAYKLAGVRPSSQDGPQAVQESP